MKSKFQDTHHQLPSFSSKESEQRIKIYRQAWLEGKLKINSKRLADRMMDFEKQLETSFTDSPAILTVKSRQ